MEARICRCARGLLAVVAPSTEVALHLLGALIVEDMHTRMSHVRVVEASSGVVRALCVLGSAGSTLAHASALPARRRSRSRASRARFGVVGAGVARAIFGL